MSGEMTGACLTFVKPHTDLSPPVDKGAEEEDRRIIGAAVYANI